MTRRKVILAGAVLLGLAVVAGWCCARAARADRTAGQVRTDLAEIRIIAARIEAVRSRPTMADEQERLSDEVTGLVEAAARQAGIDKRDLVRITPLSPQRVGDTVYKEKPTTVEVSNVSLTQLMKLVHVLLSDGRGLKAKSIRLSAPRHDDTAETWTAEVVLTYLIYDPPKSNL